MMPYRFFAILAVLLTWLAAPIQAHAQTPTTPPPSPTAPRDTGLIRPGSILDSAALAVTPPTLRDRADSLAWERARAVAERARGRRIVISVLDRRLWWIGANGDTLLSTPVAVGKGTDLEYDGRKWRFDTPRGVRRVQAKVPNPVWVPPVWRYIEEARRRGYRVAQLARGRAVRLADGSRLVVHGERVGRVLSDGTFHAIPQGDEIAFDSTVFIPPFGTVNRSVPGELGAYKLTLGDGYMIHGSPDQSVIGRPATHGCIRAPTPELERLYREVPLGTRVYIY